MRVYTYAYVCIHISIVHTCVGVNDTSIAAGTSWDVSSILGNHSVQQCVLKYDKLMTVQLQLEFPIVTCYHLFLCMCVFVCVQV